MSFCAFLLTALSTVDQPVGALPGARSTTSVALPGDAAADPQAWSRVLAPNAPPATIADVERNPERYEIYGDQARKTYEQRFDPQRSLEDLLGIYRFAIRHPV